MDSSDDYSRQAADLHNYLVERIGHNWRLKTWEKKYLARLRTYDYKKCIIAIDGFVSLKWWMVNKSQDAPDCIFRSDKSFERFLAAGMMLPDHSETVRENKRKVDERKSILAEYRARLENDDYVMRITARMFQKLKPLKEELNEHSWNVFIAPLRFVKHDNGTVILFSEDSLWVQDHFVDRIAAALNCNVKVVSEL
jgi:hypothetical protein